MPTYGDETYSCEDGCVVELISRTDTVEENLGGIYEFSGYVHDDQLVFANIKIEKIIIFSNQAWQVDSYKNFVNYYNEQLEVGNGE